jgi:hypothetical protein
MRTYGGSYSAQGQATSAMGYLPVTTTVDYAYMAVALFPGYTNSSIVSPWSMQLAQPNENTGESPGSVTGSTLKNGTAAITSIQFYDAASFTFESGSTISMFGLVTS